MNIDMICKICNKNTIHFIHNIFDDRYGYPKYFDIVHCKECKLFQTEPPLSMDEIGPLYTDYYPRQNINPKEIKEKFKVEYGFYDTFKNWLSGNHRIQYMFKKDNKKILEVGCGDGRSLLQLQTLGYEVYGIETDENIRKVRDELNLNIHIGTIENSNFDPKTFDYVTANQLIEHIVDLNSFMTSCKTILKDEGKMIFSTPNSSSLYRKIFGRKWINWHIPYHQQVFNTKSIKTLLNKHGLEITKIKTVTPTSWTLHQLSTIRHTQEFGLKNPYWNKEESTKSDKVQENKNLIKKSLLFIKRIIFFIILSVITIFNRLIDILGLGDCLIIYIKKSL